MTTDLDLSVFHDGYTERIEMEEKRPKNQVAKSMTSEQNFSMKNIIVT